MSTRSNDKQLFQWGKRLQEKADKALAAGRISRVEYRDMRWHALQAMRPRQFSNLVGLK